MAYISLNEQRIAKIVIDDGSSPSEFEINPDYPFVKIIHGNSGTIQFFDENGSEVFADNIESIIKD